MKESKGKCPLKTLSKPRECICREFAHSGKIGPCEGGLYFRQPDLAPSMAIPEEHMK